MSTMPEHTTITSSVLETLKKSESFFRALIENSSDAIALMTPEGNFLYLSPSVKKILGYTPEELVGCSGFDLLPSDQLPFAIQQFSKIAQNPGTTQIKEHQYLHKDGSLRWMESTTTNLLDNPHVQAIVANFRDITNRKQMEEQLRESEQQFRSIFESTMIGIGFWNTDGYLLDVNDTFLQIIGYTREDFQANKIRWQDITPVEYHELDQKALAENVSQGLSTPFEKEYIRKDGTRVPVLVGAALQQEQQKKGCFFVLDITEQKKAQQQVKESRDQFSAILKNTADGITVQDRTGKMIYANRAAALVAGYSSVEELLQAPLLEYQERFSITDEYGQPFPPAQLPGRRAIQGEENPQATVCYIDKSTNTKRWSIIKSTAILDAQNQPYLVINTIQDITPLKELEIRKDDFISMASHELKTPLTSIKGFTQILQNRFKKRNDDATLLLLYKMERQLNKLTNLISDLLDISKMQAGKLSYHIEPFDLDTLVHEVVENLQETTQTHHLLLESTEGLWVSGDKDRLGQVLINLLTNAIKYSPQANTIVIRARAEQ